MQENSTHSSEFTGCFPLSTFPPTPPTASQTLSSSSRDLNLITLVLKCLQAFNDVFLFFNQQNIILFFPIIFGNLSVEKHCPSGEPAQGTRTHLSQELFWDFFPHFMPGLSFLPLVFLALQFSLATHSSPSSSSCPYFLILVIMQALFPLPTSLVLEASDFQSQIALVSKDSGQLRTSPTLAS